MMEGLQARSWWGRGIGVDVADSTTHFITQNNGDIQL
jgi:hypothetical protein